MAKIVRLFGKADNFNIEFSREGRVWKTDIPPDMTDGVYAVQLTAVYELGETAYWVGELFMCNGVCCLRFMRKRRRIGFSSPGYRMTLRNKLHLVMRDTENIAVSFQPSALKITFGKECRHV